MLDSRLLPPVLNSRDTGRVTGDPTALDYVTLGIAGVGATTGIAALGATWAQFTLSGPRLRIVGGTAYGGGPWLLSVSVTNIGRMPVTIGQVSLELDGGDHIPLGLEISQGRGTGPPIPTRLDPYSEVSWYLPARQLWSGMQQHGYGRKVRPMVAHGDTKVRAKKTIDIAHIASFD